MLLLCYGKLELYLKMGISVAAYGYEKNRKGAVGGNVSLHFYIK